MDDLEQALEEEILTERRRMTRITIKDGALANASDIGLFGIVTDYLRTSLARKSRRLRSPGVFVNIVLSYNDIGTSLYVHMLYGGRNTSPASLRQVYRALMEIAGIMPVITISMYFQNRKLAGIFEQLGWERSEMTGRWHKKVNTWTEFVQYKKPDVAAYFRQRLAHGP